MAVATTEVTSSDTFLYFCNLMWAVNETKDKLHWRIKKILHVIVF